MFLRCSYFFQNLSLDVLINKVLKQSNACNALILRHLTTQLRKSVKEAEQDSVGYPAKKYSVNVLLVYHLAGYLTNHGL